MRTFGFLNIVGSKTDQHFQVGQLTFPSSGVKLKICGEARKKQHIAVDGADDVKIENGKIVPVKVAAKSNHRELVTIDYSAPQGWDIIGWTISFGVVSAKIDKESVSIIGVEVSEVFGTIEKTVILVIENRETKERNKVIIYPNTINERPLTRSKLSAGKNTPIKVYIPFFDADKNCFKGLNSNKPMIVCPGMAKEVNRFFGKKTMELNLIEVEPGMLLDFVKDEISNGSIAYNIIGYDYALIKEARTLLENADIKRRRESAAKKMAERQKAEEKAEVVSETCDMSEENSEATA